MLANTVSPASGMRSEERNGGRDAFAATLPAGDGALSAAEQDDAGQVGQKRVESDLRRSRRGSALRSWRPRARPLDGVHMRETAVSSPGRLLFGRTPHVRHRVSRRQVRRSSPRQGVVPVRLPAGRALAPARRAPADGRGLGLVLDRFDDLGRLGNAGPPCAWARVSSSGFVSFRWGPADGMRVRERGRLRRAPRGSMQRVRVREAVGAGGGLSFGISGISIVGRASRFRSAYSRSRETRIGVPRGPCSKGAGPRLAGGFRMPGGGGGADGSRDWSASARLRRRKSTTF